MILKTFELNKIKNDTIFHLLYGKNEGLKTECINQIINKNDGKIFNYDEKQIKEEIESFYENILSESLFESEKIIIVNRASDKIYEIIKDLIDRNLNDIKIIINAGILETKSKLRSLFEKKTNLATIPCYNDTDITLRRLIQNELKEYKNLNSNAVNMILNYSNLNKFKKRLDPRLYNGAIFLGLDSPVVKSHGGTDFIGFSNSLNVCEKIVNGNLIKKIKHNI